MEKMRVAVLFGGQSTEHEVSRVSAASVISSLDPLHYEVVPVGITKSGRWLVYTGPIPAVRDGSWQQLAEAENRDGIALIFSSSPDRLNRPPDVVFPVLHGRNGEDGTVQGLIKIAGLPCVGPEVLAAAVAMDKICANLLFEKAGIPRCNMLWYTREQIRKQGEEAAREVEERLHYPCFVKPANAGSSVGISKARDRRELMKAFETALSQDRRVLVEEFVDGREIECAVLGNEEPQASVVGEVVPCREFYDYEAKYLCEDASAVIIPAKLPQEVSERVREYAIRAYRMLDCSGMARVDFFVRRDTLQVLINEVNTIPGFTGISMYPKLWEASGLPFPRLLDRLIELATARHREQNAK